MSRRSPKRASKQAAKPSQNPSTDPTLSPLDATTSTEDQPLPRAKRKQRPREERGLPDRKALRELAKAYLEIQGRLWPELVKSGVLPKPTKAAITKRVQEFEDLFLAKKDLAWSSSIANAGWEAIAAVYLRYSCDKSNPRSLVQQLKLALEKAAMLKFFVPWSFVFADAGVSGMTNDRRGYELVNAALEDDSLTLEALFIDEIGRASRDAVEAMRLGQMIEDQGKNLIGVSDGFDSRSPMAKLMLSIFAALQEWFIDQLRSKVQRGMSDAHDRGTNLRPPAIGNKLVDALDADGNAIFGKDGIRSKMLAKDDATAPVILEIYEMYVTRR